LLFVDLGLNRFIDIEINLLLERSEIGIVLHGDRPPLRWRDQLRTVGYQASAVPLLRPLMKAFARDLQNRQNPSLGLDLPQVFDDTFGHARIKLEAVMVTGLRTALQVFWRNAPRCRNLDDFDQLIVAQLLQLKRLDVLAAVTSAFKFREKISEILFPEGDDQFQVDRSLAERHQKIEKQLPVLVVLFLVQGQNFLSLINDDHAGFRKKTFDSLKDLYQVRNRLRIQIDKVVAARRFAPNADHRQLFRFLVRQIDHHRGIAPVVKCFA